MRKDFEKFARVKLSTNEGHVLITSAVFSQDPKCIVWNRVSLLGNNEDEMLTAMDLHSDDWVKWEILTENEAGQESEVSNSLKERGTCHVISTNMPMRSVGTERPIQRYAEAEIYEYVSTQPSESGEPQRAEYWFLQRPADWQVYNPRSLFRDELSSKGAWTRVSSIGLKFRLVSIGWLRDDNRISRETEILRFPGIEIKPIAGQHSSFAEASEDMWFSIRILLSFRFQQTVLPLREELKCGGVWRSTVYSEAIKPRDFEPDRMARPFRGRLEPYLANGVAALAKLTSLQPNVHAAVHGYARSFGSVTLEHRLTSCVEAIETLVTAFEQARSLNRQLLPRKEWSAVERSLKQQLDTLSLSSEAKKSIKRGLSSVPSLTLQDRIERMILHFRKHWQRWDEDIARGLEGMISARNQIVHGRSVDDFDRLHVESLRAQAIFEKLFLCVTGNHMQRTVGATHSIIADYDSRS